MNDERRTSKRRKIETPKRIASAPLTKTSTRKTTARSADRTVSHSLAIDNENTVPPARSTPVTPGALKSIRSRANGAVQKPAILEDKDIYDDIEGACAPKPSPTPKKRYRTTVPADELPKKGENLGKLQEVATTPSRGKKRGKVNGNGVDRNSAGAVAAIANHDDFVEADTQSELAVEPSTPSRRSRKSAGKIIWEPSMDGDDVIVERSPSKLPSIKKSKASARKPVPENNEAGRRFGTPSRSSQRAAQPRPAIIALDSEDEFGDREPSSVSRSASARRRANRVDHTGSRDHNAISATNLKAIELATPVTAREDSDVDVDASSVKGSVLDPTEPSPFYKPSPAQKVTETTPSVFADIEVGRELDLLKSIVMDRITSKRSVPLIGLEEEYKVVHRLVEHTVTAGEGNSLLLLGARGSGKTLLVNQVLSNVSKDNSEDYHVVRLNGFIHTDDKIALREIWRQLGKEMDIDEKGGPGKNYADTLSTLLALLSHPDEHTGEFTDRVAKAVIFVIDEFDLFAQHPRQTLLYNLFDISQSRKAPIAVLGLTTHIDVVNSLEKRVKSRFSHRYVHLSLAKAFTTFQEICKQTLLLQPNLLSFEERSILESTSTLTTGKGPESPARQGVLSQWNASIESLFQSKTFLTQHLASYFYRTKSVPEVLTSFLIPIANLAPDSSLQPSRQLDAFDSKLALIPDLSTLALALLIAAARLDIIHDSDTCNFNMAYDEYVTLASKARIQSAAGGATSGSSVSKVWGKEVARREWEELVQLGLVMPVIAGQTGGFGMIKVDVALEEIGAVLAGDKSIDRGLERWCRQL